MSSAPAPERKPAFALQLFWSCPDGANLRDQRCIRGVGNCHPSPLTGIPALLAAAGIGGGIGILPARWLAHKIHEGLRE